VQVAGILQTDIFNHQQGCWNVLIALAGFFTNQAQIFGAASAMLVLLQQVMHDPLAL
jgi:hypothetical protein